MSQLTGALSDPLLDVMNFLNEIAARFPDAVSFAAGRPSEEFAGADDAEQDLLRYRQHAAAASAHGDRDVTAALFGYGPAKGLINEHVARYLEVDAGIRVDPGALVVTVGAQEGMVLVLRALRRDDADVALAVSPTYAGFTGAAKIVGIPVLPVASGPAGIDFADLRAVVAAARADGLRPRCLYVIPDFANPSGVRITVADRRRLIGAAAEADLLVLEDNPYGTYVAQGEPLPTVKALDDRRQVVYLGSFAKTVMPGARVGFVVADQEVALDGHRIGYLADQLAKIKSMITVNTSSISQAVVAGRLIGCGYRLVAANEKVTALYCRNREAMLTGLAARFAGHDGVMWTVPDGGFFVMVRVPFRADEALVEHSARRHGVLWTPMSQFYPGSTAGSHSLRLSFSALGPDEIATGLDRLAALVAEQTALVS